MSSSRSPRPTRVRSPKGSTKTEIDWDDGVTSRYQHLTLRGLCPCAACQGHDGGLRWVDAIEQASPLALELKDIEQMGNYALGLGWADGHRGGIYSFGYLRELGRLFDLPLEQLRAYRR
jgi:DUF971 family protein